MREIVDAVKTAVPDAADRPTGQVLEYVLGKLGGNSLRETEPAGN
jgi:hypothetical protein